MSIFLAFILSMFLLASAQAGEEAAYKIINTGSASGKIPVTLNFLGRKGEFYGNKIQALIDGVPVETQVREMARWRQDGSVSSALLTFLVDIQPGQLRKVTFRNQFAPVTKTFSPHAQLIKQFAMPLYVEIKEKGGRVSTLHLTNDQMRQLLTLAYLNHPTGQYRSSYQELDSRDMVREYEFSFVPKDQNGKDHPLLKIFVRWKIFMKSFAGAFVEVVVENTRMDISESQMAHIDIETAKIELGEAELKKTLTTISNDRLHYESRFAAQGWALAKGAPDPTRVIIRPAVRYLAELDLAPPLDDSFSVSESKLQAWIDNLLESDQRGDVDINQVPGIPLNRGPVYRYQPGTGDRADINSAPNWVLAAYNSPHYNGHVLALSGDMNGSGDFSIHLRKNDRQLCLTYDDPFWRDQIRFDPGGVSNDNKENAAHMPLLGFFGYVTTGDKKYLEELVCWTAFALRDNFPNEGIPKEMDRHLAWTYRNLAYLLAVLPDSDPLKNYFWNILDKNAAYHANKLDTSLTPGLFGYGNHEESGGTLATVPTTKFTPWQMAWADWAVLLLHVLHHEPRFKAVADHGWNYLQAYTSKDQWVSPEGTRIDARPHDLWDYKPVAGVFTPQLDKNGNCEPTPGTLQTFGQARVNWAQLQYLLDVHGSSHYDKGNCWGDLVGKPFTYAYPRDANGNRRGFQYPEANTDYHEYALRTGLLYLGGKAGMPNAKAYADVAVPSFIIPRYEYKEGKNDWLPITRVKHFYPPY